MSGTPKRLGRGLSALIGDLPDRSGSSSSDVSSSSLSSPSSSESSITSISSRSGSGVVSVPLGEIRTNRRNPRRRFDESDLADLASSISERGVIQPILVRPASSQKNGYELVAGERRWRAAMKAGLHEIPVIVREVNDREALEIAIIENVQRSDLNPIEEALGYQELLDEHDYRQEDLAKVVGKSRSHVANTLRLLGLPESVRSYVEDGSLSAGHARALLVSDSAEELARRVVSSGLSVRETERLVSGGVSKRNKKTNTSDKDADTLALERDISDSLGLKVLVDHKRGGDSGKVTLYYNTLDQLDDLIARLRQN